MMQGKENMKNESLRSEKLIKNTFWATFGYIIYALIGFVSRSIFVNQLGDTITGVATLFSSILSLLSMAELGFGTAISIHLYKPVAENDHKKVAALINLYRKTYTVIAFVVLAIGMLLLPFLNIIVKSDGDIANLRLYYVLYILKSVVSYCYAYKSVLITVSQESHFTANISNMILVLVTLGQTLILHFKASFIGYLIIGIFGTLVTNILVSAKADKLYPYLNEFRAENVSDEEKQSIYSFIKATAVDRISISIKSATDNMIISGVVNIAVTGIVGNYNMIISTAYTFLGFFFNNATPAVGNMVATADKDSQYNTFLDFEYITFWLYGFVSVGMLCTLTPFVRDIWIRKPGMVLSPITLFLIVFNFFFTGTCIPASIFFSVKGLIKKMPLINAITVILNLIFSLWLVGIYDVNGVYMGTILSFMMTNLTLTHYYVLKYHFDGRYGKYLALYAKCLAIVAVCRVACVCRCNKIAITGFIGIIAKVIFCSMVYNIMFFTATFRSREFISIFTLIKNILKSRLA